MKQNLEKTLHRWKTVSESAFSFLVTIVPYITEQNVGDLLSHIPEREQLCFLRYVTYQKPNGSYGSLFEGTVKLDKNFYDGLKIVREHFASEEILQFGDLLLLEKNRLETHLKGFEGTSHQHVLDAREELSQIDSLLEKHPPSVLQAGHPAWQRGNEKGQ